MKKGLIVTILTLFSFAIFFVTGCGKKNEMATEEVVLPPMEEVLTPAAEVVPTSDSNSVGLMAFYPNNNENMYALAGTNTFTLYFQNKRVSLGEGKIGIYDSQSNAIYASVAAEDSERFEIGAMDDIGKSLTGWEEGTRIDIYFDKMFLPGTNYYVLIDEGFFNLGSVKSEAVTNSSLITFSTKDYGVDMSGVNLDKEYNVGDLISFNVLVDGKEATMYALKEYDATFIDASPINGTEDTDLSLKFLQPGNPSITVTFYKAGSIVDSISFSFKVSGTTAGDEASSNASKE